MSGEEELKKQLASLSGRSAVSLVTDLDSYLMVIKAVASHATESGAKCVYVTATVPARVVAEQLANGGVKTDALCFVDAISLMVGSAAEDGPKTTFVESPTMLESIMLKVDTWLKRLRGAKSFIFLDSLSSLAMHNDPTVLSEFVHVFVNHIRSKGVPSIMLSVAGQTPEELETVTKLVCDETLQLKAEELGERK